MRTRDIKLPEGSIYLVGNCETFVLRFPVPKRADIVTQCLYKVKSNINKLSRVLSEIRLTQYIYMLYYGYLIILLVYLK